MQNAVNPTTPDPEPATRDELAEELDAARHELRALAERGNELEAELDRVGIELAAKRRLAHSTSALVGRALVQAATRPDGLVSLPRDLLGALRQAIERRRVRRARRVLEAAGYRISPIPRAALGEGDGGPRAARIPKNYRETYEALLAVARQIPDSNGSRLHAPLPLDVAIVTDEFMFNYYRSIFRSVVYVSPDDHAEAFLKNRFDLFLMVSGWSGMRNDDWRGIGYREKPRTALDAILQTCRSRGIPTVFQSIEDPSNYEHFLPIARRFEHIVTTDLDCVDRYRADTDARSVQFGEFGANPLFNNPIGLRRHAWPGALFAGSYPSRYPERCRDMHTVFDSLIGWDVDLMIVDRNSDRPSEAFAFPPQYRDHLVPKLGHALLQKLHKVVAYNVNFNSIKHSPTMCAMRVYELQAQGALLLSNYARSVVNRFPLVDLVNLRVDASRYFAELDGWDAYERRVAAVRSVMTARTGFDQARRMVQGIGIDTGAAPDATVLVVAESLTPMMRAQFDVQRHAPKCLATAEQYLRGGAPAHRYVTFFDPAQEYEADYLVDLVNAFKYTDVDYTCRVAWFSPDGFVDGPQHEFVERVPDRHRTLFDATRFAPGELLGLGPEHPAPGGYAIDPFELNATRFLERRAPRADRFELSVVIPVHDNGEFLLHKCLASLRRNALFPQMELLLIDDGSSDPYTLELLQRLVRRHPNARLHRFDDSGSGSASRPRNQGMRMASAPLVTFLDPDNEISPGGYDLLHRLFHDLEAEGRPVDLVAGYQLKVGSEQTITAKHAMQRLSVVDDPRREVLLERRFPIVSTQAAVIRRSFLIASGVDFVIGAVGQDTLFGHELLARASRVAFTSSAYICYYAERGNSVTNTLDLRFFEKSLILELAQVERLAKVGLLDAYRSDRFPDFFAGWYLVKLRGVDDAIRPAATAILERIAGLYTFDLQTLTQRGEEVIT